MKNISNKVWAILLIIITAISTYFVNSTISKSNQNDQNRPRSFDQFINVRPVDYTQLEEEKFKIFYDNIPIHGYNDVKIILYNYEDKTFNDVRVYITLKPQAGDSLKLIAATINGDREIIKPLKDSLSPEKGALELGYIIAIANPTTVFNTPVFDINIQINSIKPPSLPIVKLYCNGLNSTPEPQEYTWDRFSKLHVAFFDTSTGEFVEILLIFIPSYIIIVLLLVKLINLFPRPAKEKRNKEKQIELIRKIEEKIKAGEIVSDDYKKIIDTYIKAKNESDYNSSSKLNRWISNMKAPQ